MRMCTVKAFLSVCLCLAMGLPFVQLAQAAPDAIHIVFIPQSSDQVFGDLMRAGVDRAVQEDPRIKLT